MKFKCNCCKYSTDNQSNFNKHLKTEAHINNSENVETFSCECGKDYSCKQSLCRHRLHYCKNKSKNKSKSKKNQKKRKSNDDEPNIFNMKEEMIKLVNEVAELKATISNKTINVNNGNINNNNIINNINITVKTYVQNYYPDAPALIEFNEYEQFENTNTKDKPLINQLAFRYRTNGLSKYLGDFIVKCYKKDDPTQQSVWSSDISRLNYVVKELLGGNKSKWYNDENGEKVKKYIVNPLLAYIYELTKDYIDESDKALDDQTEKYRKQRVLTDSDLKTHTDGNNVRESICKMQTDIENGIISNDIVKYIAPFFYLEKENVDEEPDKTIKQIEHKTIKNTEKIKKVSTKKKTKSNKKSEEIVGDYVDDKPNFIDSD